MEDTVFENIPFQLDIDALRQQLRIKEGSANEEDLIAFGKEAESVARPKALYRVVYFDTLDDDQVIIDGISLKSHVLKVNIQEAHRVFPFVATCGTEIEEWSKSQDDVVKRFWGETIKGFTLQAVFKFLDKQLKSHFDLERTSIMTPGSIQDWPIQEQQPLFEILGSLTSQIGVEINESMLMNPVYSVSGILFPTEVKFENCQLCPRENCPGRRAEYEPDLYDEKYKLAVKIDQG
jgi:hypothetical protein